MAINCSNCGKFCIPVNGGAMYGESCDFEPPEPEEYCPACSDMLMKGAISHPECVIFGCWCYKPDYVRVAKSILRHRKRDR